MKEPLNDRVCPASAQEVATCRQCTVQTFSGSLPASLKITLPALIGRKLSLAGLSSCTIFNKVNLLPRVGCRDVWQVLREGQANDLRGLACLGIYRAIGKGLVVQQ